MPARSPRKCGVVNCPVLTTERYCPSHMDRVRDSDRVYQKNRQDAKEQEFYGSTAWKKLRQYKKTKNPLCEVCLANDELNPTELIHHIIEVKDDWDLRLVLSNLQSVCMSCHNKIHGKKQYDS